MKNISKRVFSVLLVAVMMVSLTACGGDKKADGNTYTAEGEKSEYGYHAVEVTMKDGKMEKIDLKRMDADGKEVNYDEWDGTSEDGKPNLKEAKETVSKEMLEKQSTDVDNIAGATNSVDEWKKLVDEAVKKAK